MSTTRTTRIILTTATWLGWSALVAGLLAGGSHLVGALPATPPPEATPVATAATPVPAVPSAAVRALPPAVREDPAALGEAVPAAVAPASGQRGGGQRTRAIEALVPGDWVLARNEQTGEVTPRRVLRVFRRVVDHVRRVRVRPAGGGDVQEVRTTEEHPFWVQGQGWVPAGRLQPGDRLLQADGRTAVVEASRFVRQPAGQVVHNLEVEGDHCYAVRAGGSAAELVWVHNSRECLPDSPGTGPITDPRRMLPPPRTLPPLRQAYINEVEALKGVASRLRTAGKTPEEIARALHQMRRDIGIKYKDLTSPEMLERIYQRNLHKYGDKLGPTIEYLRGQGRSWEEIIESASRTGGADLGLAK